VSGPLTRREVDNGSYAFSRHLLFVAATVAGIAVVFAGPARVAQSAATSNLLKNGGAELGSGAIDSSGVVKTIPGWVRTGNFTVVKYGSSGGFPDAAASKAVAGGKQFFAGGPSNPNSRATQTVSVASRAAAIDGGKLNVTLAGYLGGFGSQSDSLTVTASFLDASGQKVGAIKIGPVTVGQRKSETTLVAKAATVKVPAKTRSILVSLSAVRTDGSYNDGYADNLQLTLPSSR
jgi:hypothetical protein